MDEEKQHLDLLLEYMQEVYEIQRDAADMIAACWEELHNEPGFLWNSVKETETARFMIETARDAEKKSAWALKQLGQERVSAERIPLQDSQE